MKVKGLFKDLKAQGHQLKIDFDQMNYLHYSFQINTWLKHVQWSMSKPNLLGIYFYVRSLNLLGIYFYVQNRQVK
jgi:hypothetical protein